MKKTYLILSLIIPSCHAYVIVENHTPFDIKFQMELKNPAQPIVALEIPAGSIPVQSNADEDPIRKEVFQKTRYTVWAALPQPGDKWTEVFDKRVASWPNRIIKITATKDPAIRFNVEDVQGTPYLKR